jgi:hypothetical protein
MCVNMCGRGLYARALLPKAAARAMKRPAAATPAAGAGSRALRASAWAGHPAFLAAALAKWFEATPGGVAYDTEEDVRPHVE